MSEATLKPPRGPAPRCAPPPTEGGWADSPWQRLRDALPPRTVCGLAVLVSLLIPALLLWFPMPMVIGGVVGLLILTLVLACPYAGLIIFLGLLYLRPEEIFPKLAGARMT